MEIVGYNICFFGISLRLLKIYNFFEKPIRFSEELSMIFLPCKFHKEDMFMPNAIPNLMHDGNVFPVGTTLL